MIEITSLSHLFKGENFHNWLLTEYFFGPLHVCESVSSVGCAHVNRRVIVAVGEVLVGHISRRVHVALHLLMFASVEPQAL